LKTKLGEISEVQSGIYANTVNNGNVIYLHARHFDEKGNLVAELNPDLHLDDIAPNHLLIPGDILFAAKGQKNFATVFEPHNPPSVASTSFFVIRLTDNEILPGYIAWFLNQPKSKTLLKETAKGTSIPSIRKPDLQNLPVDIPSLEKQQLILQIAGLMVKEEELRIAIKLKRKQLTELQIINTILKLK